MTSFWKELFEELLNNNRETQEMPLDQRFNLPKEENINKLPNTEEVRKIVKTIKNNSAPGADNTPGIPLNMAANT